MTNNKDILISFIVCTHARSREIFKFLDSFQKLDDKDNSGAYELLVVENGPKDKGLEDHIHRINDSRIVYLYNKEPNLSSARNHGMAESKGKYVHYLDDDVLFIDEKWLGCVIEVAKKGYDAYGGGCRPFYDEGKVKWFKDEYGESYVNRKSGLLQGRETLYGFNMAFKRCIIESLQGFREDCGYAGAKVIYGDDTEMQYRLRKMHKEAKIYISSDLILYHKVHRSRQSLKSSIARAYRSGYDLQRIYTEYDVYTTGEKKIKRLCGVALKSLVMVGDLISIDREKYMYRANVIYEKGRDIAFTLGKVVYSYLS